MKRFWEWLKNFWETSCPKCGSDKPYNFFRTFNIGIESYKVYQCSSCGKTVGIDSQGFMLELTKYEE